MKDFFLQIKVNKCTTKSVKMLSTGEDILISTGEDILISTGEDILISTVLNLC